ncbi:hypothetical protein KEM55_004335 [Ascosphaera atra]|nr:hypothetical protein KEM55_004335 [Ascosphaera atra]
MSRPKRPNLPYGDISGLEQEPSSKKPRFDVRNPSTLAANDEIDEEDNDYLDADAIGRRGQRVRRNAVAVEGYESDSENEGFDARAEQIARERKEAERENEQSKGGKGNAGGLVDDMFAVEDEEDQLAEDFGLREQDEEGKKKKQVKFMEDKDIEGQDKRSRGGHTLHVDFRAEAEGKGKGKARKEEDESESESEVDDETRDALDETVDTEIGAGGKKQHAPLLDAFNMRAEQEEGRFDESGNYVRNAVDPDAVYDTWLEGLSKKEMRKAREAHEKREQERRRQAAEQDQILTADLLRDLIVNLERGENVIEALARLNKGQKSKPKWQNKQKAKRKKQGEDIEMKEKEAEDPAEVTRKKAIDTITGAADSLLARGQPDIYDAERELLTRQYKRETGEDWVDSAPQAGAEEEEQMAAPSASNMWEFRWSDARDGGGVHGPYDGATMQQWAAAGYFGEGVEFRKAGGQGDWTANVSFT